MISWFRVALSFTVSLVKHLDSFVMISKYQYQLDWILGHLGMAYVWAAWWLCRDEILMLETPEEILVPLEIRKSEHIG